MSDIYPSILEKGAFFTSMHVLSAKAGQGGIKSQVGLNMDIFDPLSSHLITSHLSMLTLHFVMVVANKFIFSIFVNV